MFFANAGIYKPCNIFSLGHMVIAIATLLAVIVALKLTSNKDVNKIIKYCTLFLWFLEVIMIIYKIQEFGTSNVNRYVPLYYCSLILYAGLFSTFGKGIIKRIGDVFIATGAIIGGISYLVYPSTSLPEYPLFHIVSFHSFLFHGMLVYLGVLVNITNYVKLEKKDIIYYASLVGITCAIAFIINCIFDSNLMFISKNFPGTILETAFSFMGNYYTSFAIIGQMTLPFCLMYEINRLIVNRNDLSNNNQEEQEKEHIKIM